VTVPGIGKEPNCLVTGVAVSLVGKNIFLSGSLVACHFCSLCLSVSI
jgi:hypothetical protein